MSTVSIEARLAHVEGTVGQIGDRLNGLDARFSNLERKIDVGLEALQNRMDQRFSAIDGRFAAIDGRFVAIDGRFAEMDRRFTWLIGLVALSILVPIAQHFILR